MEAGDQMQVEGRRGKREGRKGVSKEEKESKR